VSGGEHEPECTVKELGITLVTAAAATACAAVMTAAAPASTARAGHIVSENNSRPISMRRISLVPAPISYSLASRHSRPRGYSLM
jgi:diaminopimelate epimerase